MKRLITLIALSFLFLGLSAQEWEVVFDDVDNSLFLNDVCKIDDDFCLFVGARGVKDSEADAFVIKMSSDGEYETRVLDVEDSYSRLMTVVRLDDGDFFIVGWLKNFRTDSTYVWNIVMDEEMNIIREKKHPADDMLSDVSDGRCVKRSNGNVVFTCVSKYMMQNAKYPGCYIVEYDPDCNMVKSNLFNDYNGYFALYYRPYNIFEIPGSDEIIVLCTGLSGCKSMIYFDSDFSFVKDVCFQTEPSVSPPEGYGIFVDDVNIKLWLSALWWDDSKYHKGGAVVGNYNIQTEVMSIQTELTSGDPYDTVYYANGINGVAKTADGKLLCYGSENVDYVFTPRLFVFDDNENFIYSIFFEDYQEFFAGLMLPTADGGCLLHMSKRTRYGWINTIKKISSETLSADEHIPEKYMTAVYPNPAGDYLYLQLNDDGACHRITVCDMFGMTVSVTDDVSGRCSPIYVGNLNPGVYFYQITSKNQIIKKGKFVKI